VAQTVDLQVRVEPLPPLPVVTAQPAYPRLATQPLRRLPTAWQNPPGASLWPPAVSEVEDDPLHQQLLARSIGELVHLGLKQCVERGHAWLQHDSDPPLWRRTLAPLCADSAALAAALASVRKQLLSCVHSTELGWLFQGRQRDDACELALVDYGLGYRKDHVIDRTFIDAEGTRWIIDYKSSTPGKDQSLPGFLQEQSARYRPQLLGYAALFRQQPQPLKLALLFTMLPALQLLET
jgi:ATP-dependent exoDNAse (exonuclease V) beta subunit